MMQRKYTVGHNLRIIIYDLLLVQPNIRAAFKQIQSRKNEEGHEGGHSQFSEIRVGLG